MLCGSYCAKIDDDDFIIVSEELLDMDTHTDRQTDSGRLRQNVQVAYDFANKNDRKQIVYYE